MPMSRRPIEKKIMAASTANTGAPKKLGKNHGFWITVLMPCMPSIAEAGMAASRPHMTEIE